MNPEYSSDCRTLTPIYRHMLRASCAFFASEVLRGPPEPPYNGRFLVGRHHEDWDALLSRYDRLCILAARDHGKTFFWDLAFPIWNAWRQPYGSGYIFSATQPQAIRILADIRHEIEGNVKLRALLPDTNRAWSSTFLRLRNGHTITCRGFGSRVRGAHPNWIVVDDAINDESIYSELVREKQRDYYFTAITNMVVPGGRIVVVGTPFHADDLYGELKRNDEYVWRRYAAEREDGSALWPQRYPKTALKRRKKEIGHIRYAREFLCEPISDDMSLFPGYLFRGEQVEQMTVTLGMPYEYWQEQGVTAYMGCDFAISSSVGADAFVLWVMGTDKHGNRWIIDIIERFGASYQEQLSLINEWGHKYKCALINLESNQMQRIFGDELIRTTSLPIRKFETTGSNKNCLEKGVPSLRVLLENGKYRIPRGDKHSIDVTNRWIEQMRAFTWHEGKLQSVGTHDDMVMANWVCDYAIRYGGFDFSFGDEDDKPLSEREMDELLYGPPGEDSGMEQSPASGNLGGDDYRGGDGMPDVPYY